ncbi:hypothetical protein MEBOL_005805 [Melittangium boletus DSM 14713]|uniref:Uncharacterized protein n=1 Tax=Melittangium boletus DSM 14713 TaxID=1294270 RepID=A0A250IM31_9BACT|nr:hypothetical protein MEBOL_005805 [Melittangium boletus DSM 14713]
MRGNLSADTYQIRLDVELERGQFHRLSWANKSGQWAQLDRRARNETVVWTPLDHFSLSTKVMDVTAGSFDPSTGTLSDVSDPKCIQSRSLIFILESPHADEYDEVDGVWTPKEPLWGSRDEFRCKLKDVLVPLKLQSPIRIVLCNPVQWQTSLHRFYSINPKIGKKWKIQGLIRKQIWCRLWNYEPSEEMSIRSEFKARLNAYKPQFIINACTRDFRKAVGLLLEQSQQSLQVQPYRVNHPCLWKYTANRLLTREWYLPGDTNMCEQS